MSEAIRNALGRLDIYLVDQIMKGRYVPGEKILDAGCGSGRNLWYFLQNGFEVHAIDQNAEYLQQVQQTAQILGIELPASRLQTGSIQQLPYENNLFDHVICNAVLHFAANQPHFMAMFSELYRVLKPGGTLFVRIASDIGIEHRAAPLGDGIYALPDGSTRFLLTRALIRQLEEHLPFQYLERIKTTNVEDLRCMTTLVVAKG